MLPPALPVGSVPPTRDLCLPCPQHEPSILHCRHPRPITCVSVCSLPPKRASPMATVPASLGCQKSPRECGQLRKCAVQSLPFTWMPSRPPGILFSKQSHGPAAGSQPWDWLMTASGSPLHFQGVLWKCPPPEEGFLL